MKYDGIVKPRMRNRKAAAYAAWMARRFSGASHPSVIATTNCRKNGAMNRTTDVTMTTYHTRAACASVRRYPPAIPRSHKPILKFQIRKVWRMRPGGAWAYTQMTSTKFNKAASRGGMAYGFIQKEAPRNVVMKN